MFGNPRSEALIDIQVFKHSKCYPLSLNKKTCVILVSVAEAILPLLAGLTAGAESKENLTFSGYTCDYRTELKTRVPKRVTGIVHGLIR